MVISTAHALNLAPELGDQTGRFYALSLSDAC